MDELFAGGDLSSHLNHELDAVSAIVDGLAADFLLDRTDEEVLAHLLGARRVPLLDLDWEQAWSPGPSETHLDVQHNWQYGGAGRGRPVLIPADVVTVHVPFTGDPALLRTRPNQWTAAPPIGRIGAGELIYTVTSPTLTSEQVTSGFDEFRRAVTFHINAANADIQQHNRQLEGRLAQRIAERRSRLLAQRHLAASLPFQLRPTAAATYPVPVRRAKVHLTQPRPSQPFQPQPALDEATYEDVLRLIVGFTTMVERTPGTSRVMGEEELRDHLLLVLNGSFEGQAAGEVFNRNGKTDILLRIGDRNAFIAECKIWDGASKFTSAVDQLLSYLVWRDGKAALLLFIRGNRPTEIIRRADQAITTHPQCLRRHDPTDPSIRIDYLLRSTADPERAIRTALIPIAIAAPTT